MASRAAADKICAALRTMSPVPRPTRSRLPLLLALLAPACTYVSGDERVLVTSTPAGAHILVDGQDTGQTTPSMVALGGIAGSDHQITLRKRGFGDEVRDVYHYTTAYTATWNKGAVDVGIWNLPLWWPLGDWVLPAGVRYVYVPHELHVQLYAEGKGPVSNADANAQPAPPALESQSPAR